MVMSWELDSFGGLAGASRHKARRRFPLVTVHDRRNGEKFRGGQVLEVADGAIRVRLQIEASIVGDIECSVSTWAGGSLPIRGDAVIARVVGESPDFTIAALRPGRPTYPHSDQSAALARGEFWPAACNGHLRDVPEFYGPEGGDGMA